MNMMDKTVTDTPRKHPTHRGTHSARTNDDQYTVNSLANAGYPDIIGDMKNVRKNGRPVERSWPCCPREITLALFQSSDKAVQYMHTSS